MRQSATMIAPRTPSVARRRGHRRRRRRALLTLALTVAVLTLGVLYGAYGYQPSEARAYRSPYLRMVPSRFVDTPVARFHYVHAGTGSPVILVSPGAAWVFAWQRQLPALAARHSVYVVDLPGQGYTVLKDPHFQWDLAGMTDALGSFMDALHVRRAALVGNSWSGGWALAFAQRHPERVSRLALLDPSGLDIPDVWSWEILKYPVVGELLTNLFTTTSAVRDSARSLVVHQDLVTDDMTDALWAPLTFRDNLRATYLLERGLYWRETERAMPTTRTPTLVLWGRQDTILPVWRAWRFGRLLPRARVHVLDHCGHALELDCPGPVNALLRGFLDGR